MTTFPGSPRIQKGGIVLLDPASGAVQRIIALQYNPDTLTRTLQIHGISAEAGDRVETMRLKGPPTEIFKLEAEIDATDQLEIVNQSTVDVGLYPQLAALETIVYPSSSTLQANNVLAAGGTLEIMPVEAPLTLFIWSKNRIVPVILTEFSIVEEAFDPALNPIRAKVNLSMRVLSVNDVAFNERASSLYMAYQQQKECLASRNTGAILGSLGIGTSAFTV
ncbi:hypothetical protein PAALTS15_18218 [Paenibacillus alvei TS-15]|uniref:Uncharacterized protein n=1 Tax=Paenibacillus alvei TS-15 TaxID=1117108 RepID=S9SIW8_PAEAL|nr:hypothetical protein [Paenibacillus alvei]EPY05762.1 hypothetical protein PAALTS15_18218 [Paenibacillus alvei TS-15]